MPLPTLGLLKAGGGLGYILGRQFPYLRPLLFLSLWGGGANKDFAVLGVPSGAQFRCFVPQTASAVGVLAVYLGTGYSLTRWISHLRPLISVRKLR